MPDPSPRAGPGAVAGDAPRRPQRVLIVKLTSLGDVIKALPVVDDIHRALPGATVDWVVERPVERLLALCEGLDAVIPLELRRFRKERRYGAALRAALRDLGQLRARRYDCIVDLQGRRKSAIVAALARGPVIGPAPGPSSEPMYHRLYRRSVDRASIEGLDAITVNRVLAARALGYPLPERAPHFGLRAAAPPPSELAPQAPFAVLVHGSSRPEKTWPEADWIELGRRLSRRGLRCLLPWGDAGERARALRLAAGIGDAVVPERMPSLPEWVGLLGAARLVVGVDSGLTHLAAASGAPTIAIFTATSAAIFRVEADTPHRNLGDGRRLVPLSEVLDAADALLAAS